MSHCTYDSGLTSCKKKLFDNKFCIFHSPEIDKKSAAFETEFWKEFEIQKSKRNKFDFSGYIFPTYFEFNHAIFTKSVSFYSAIFTGFTDFSNCCFNGPETTFNQTIFLGETTFANAIFHGDKAAFGGSCFIADSTTSFHKAIFKTKEFYFYIVNSISKNDDEYSQLNIPAFEELKLDREMSSHSYLSHLEILVVPAFHSAERIFMDQRVFVIYAFLLK